MNSSFGVVKFRSLLLAGTVSVLANTFGHLIDVFLSGNMLGASALAGVNLVLPCLSFGCFIGGLVSSGTATLYSISMGRCDRKGAHRIFTQGLWTALIGGGALAAAFFFGRNAILSFYGASGDILAAANGYFGWIWPVAFLEVALMFLVAIAQADGNARLCVAGYAVDISLNAILSFLFVRLGYGTAGVAKATLISSAVGVAVMCFHFAGRTSTARLVRWFSPRDSFAICRASFGDSSAFLCDTLVFVFLNKFVAVHLGESALSIVGVVSAVWGMMVFTDGVGAAIQPIVTIYYGEGNTLSVRKVMRSAILWSVLEGMAAIAVTCFFAETIVQIIGIDDPRMIDDAVLAVRLVSCGILAKSLAGLFNSYYMFIEQPMLAGALTFASYLVMPIAGVAVMSVVGNSAIWLGFGLGSLLGCIVVALFIATLRGWDSFPLLLDRSREAKLHVFNLRLAEREIVDVSRRIGSMPGVPMRAALVAEETFMIVRERAKGKTLHGEVTLDLNDGVRLTLRDDGEIFDITDADAAVSSLRSYLVSSVMGAGQKRLNFVTTGFNRNVFDF